MYYFVHDTHRDLYRSEGPGDAQKWTPKAGEWAQLPDPDGHWLWRAWGFGGSVELTSMSEEQARARWPAAFTQAGD